MPPNTCLTENEEQCCKDTEGKYNGLVCPNGVKCIGGLCGGECDSDNECPSGKICQKNLCKPKTISCTNYGSWPVDDWFINKKPYILKVKTIDDCYNDCIKDKKCKTMTHFQGSDDCSYYDYELQPSDITYNIGNGWEGLVGYQTSNKNDTLNSCKFGMYRVK